MNYNGYDIRTADWSQGYYSSTQYSDQKVHHDSVRLSQIQWLPNSCNGS